MARRIVAYLSHSYRPEDRPVNMTLWRRLNDLGFVFAIDPPSREMKAMDVTFLERMMQRSDCFIAIVPDRSRIAQAARGGASTPSGVASPNEPSWSPYQEFECRLAMRADKPMMVIAEANIDAGPPHQDDVFYFERRLRDVELPPGFDQDVQRLAERALGRVRAAGPIPPVGIVRWKPEHPLWARMIDAVQARPRRFHKILEVDARTPDHELLGMARAMSVLVLDMNPAVTPPHVVALLHGASVPLFRTCLLEPGSTADEAARALGLSGGQALEAARADAVRLPPLLHGYKVDPRMTPVLFWDDGSVDEGASRIALATESYRFRERDLETVDNGRAYFLSLRGNRVFVSAPGDLLDMGVAVASELENAGFPAFHYKRTPMELGELWKPQLQREMAARDLAIILVSRTYWDRDECVDELAQAVDRWERHQLLLQIYVEASEAKLPGFLVPYQAGEVRRADPIAKMVPDDVRTRFGKGDQIGIGDQDRHKLEGLIERHFDYPGGIEDLLVKVCKLERQDWAPIVTETANSKRVEFPAAALLRALENGVQIERFGGGALGRLIYHVRKLERDPKTRQWLSPLPSRWRLFSGLHDVYAWRQRQRRQLVDLTFASGNDPKGGYALITSLSGESAEWLDAVRQTGHELAKILEPQCIAAIGAEEGCRVRATTDVERLGIPLDWTALDDSHSVGRTRPMFRQVTGLLDPRTRASIEDQLDRGEIGPPRVLVFGYGPPELPNVRKEVDGVVDRFVQNYRRRGWPVELVQGIASDNATKAELEARLVNSDYEIVHLAGHSGSYGNEPALLVLGNDDSAWVRAEELGRWLRESSTRFVHLSCCAGAAPSLRSKVAPGMPETLCREVLQAGVPEVLAYLWPVGDERTLNFVLRFYDTFLDEFDAPQAIYKARAGSGRNDPLWAASVLVKQQPS